MDIICQIISSDPPCKDDNARFKIVPENLNIIKRFEDIVVFRTAKP